MAQKGFTLVELILVVAIMGILLTIATVGFRDMMLKNNIESEAKTLYTDLMAVRLDSLYSKRGRSVIVSGTVFKVYSSNVTTVPPTTTKTLRFPLKWDNTDASRTISFDSSGLIEGEIPLCVDHTGSLTPGPAAVDSLVISQARMKLGKRQGGTCETGGIVTK